MGYLLALATTGCSAETKPVINEPTERPGALGVLPEASFDSLTLRVSGGMPDSSGNAADSEYTLNGELGYLRSRRHSEENLEFLTIDEFESVLSAYSALVVGSSGICGADKPLITLEVEDEGTTTVYVDDFYSCTERVEGAIPVLNIDELYHLLRDLA